MLKEIRPMLWTKEVKATVDFYVTQLGFTCSAHTPDWQWAAFHRDNTELMAALPNAHTPFVLPIFTGSFYIHTDAVDALWEEFKDKARICYPVETFDYGMREFALYDYNGYLLQFGQEASKISQP
ncbi:VOC family protein [Chitinophagaceae bacterium MMS25-I14]